jgi:hypothetical protein
MGNSRLGCSARLESLRHHKIYSQFCPDLSGFPLEKAES